MSGTAGSSARFLKNLVLSHPEHDGAIKAVSHVLERVEAALLLRSDDAMSATAPRVVTLIPPNFSLSMVIDCYQAGVRHFGEMTPHELIRKAEDEDVLRHCPDIKWHFYGPIQPSVATSRLVKTANLYMIESVTDETIATVLDHAAAAVKREDLLKVMVQVAGSEEEKKLGLISPTSSPRLCRYIQEYCPYLELRGLMINPSSRNENESANNDFDRSVQALTMARLDVCRGLHLEVEEFELSVGGTWDFERAIEMGSSNVKIPLDSLGLSPPDYSSFATSTPAEGMSAEGENDSK